MYTFIKKSEAIFFTIIKKYKTYIKILFFYIGICASRRDHIAGETCIVYGIF